MQVQAITGTGQNRSFSSGTYTTPPTIGTFTIGASPSSPYVFQPNDIVISIIHGDTDSYVTPNDASWILYNEIYPTGPAGTDRYRIYYKVLTASDLNATATATGPNLYGIGALSFAVRGTAGTNALISPAQYKISSGTGNMSNNATNIVFFDSANASPWTLSSLDSSYFTRYDIVWVTEEYQNYNSPNLLSVPVGTGATDVVSVGKDSSYLYSNPEKLQVFKHSSAALAAGRYYYTVPVAGQSNITWRYQVTSLWLRNGVNGQQMIL